jgi:eukaryotic-like serine/threonine-protein kinase
VAIAYQHVRENPVPPSRVDPEIPTWADSIVLRAMAKDPGDRYQSAGEMRNDIQRALQGMPVAAPTRFDAYQGTRRMGQPTQMAGPTSAIPPYDYGPEDEPLRSGRKKWPWVVAALIAVAIVAGLIYGFNYISSSGGNIAVPNVVGYTQASAQKTIVQAGLVPSVVDEASSSVTKGDVIGTSPPFGTKLSKNSTVKLLVSTGPAQVSVPNVVNMSETAAMNELQGKGFSVSERAAPNSTAPANTVVRQSPGPGAMVTKGSTVTIYVSGGGTRVPGVLGDTQLVATQTLENDGFTVNAVTNSGPPGSTPGTVWNMSPSAGTLLPQGSQVTIDVAAQPVTSTPSPTPTVSPTTSPSPTPNPSAS